MFGEPKRRCSAWEPGWLLPIRSVGVQGDSRSYRAVLALDNLPDDEIATELVNSSIQINRVVGLVRAHAPIPAMRATPGRSRPSVWIACGTRMPSCGGSRIESGFDARSGNFRWC